MSNRREKMFECAYRTGAEESRMAFRAWSAEEALRNVEEVLRQAGVRAEGDITVRDSRGRVVLRSPSSALDRAVGAA